MIKRILFQGDSITDAGRNKTLSDTEPRNYFSNELGHGYALMAAACLQQKFAPREFEFINRGIRGDKILNLYARWNIDALYLKPDLISILVGANDTWHEKLSPKGISLERFISCYQMVLSWTQEVLPETEIVLMEPFALPFAPRNVDELYLSELRKRAVAVKCLAEDFRIHFIPLQDRISAAAAQFTNDKMVLLDGIHPALTGSQIIAQAYVEALTPILEKSY